MFQQTRERPGSVWVGNEMQSGGHIVVFVLPLRLAAILFPTDTISGPFSVTPQMKESTWFFCRCRASAHRSGRTRKFNSSVHHARSGARTFPPAEFPDLLPSDLDGKEKFSLGRNNMPLWRSCDKRPPLNSLWTCSCKGPRQPSRLPSASHAKIRFAR